MAANPYEQARWAAVEAAAPLELVLLLFTRALECVARARQALAEGDIPGRAHAIQGAMDCVVELARSLNRDEQPALTQSLAELYVFVLDRLREANFRQKAGPLDDAEPVLRTLLEAWTECRARLQSVAPRTALDSSPGVPATAGSLVCGCA